MIKNFNDFQNDFYIPKFETGYDIINYFNNIPEFKPYNNPNANGDDPYFEIPKKIFDKVLGWPNNAIKNIDKGLNLYSGNIFYDRKMEIIYVLGEELNKP